MEQEQVDGGTAKLLLQSRDLIVLLVYTLYMTVKLSYSVIRHCCQ